ncbi:MAG TPA: hypothetical protein VKS22_15380 [Candidatus Binataceae bacterium]|nr:hypothetical protein [Candidatus Binataceae bacterium]
MIQLNTRAGILLILSMTLVAVLALGQGLSRAQEAPPSPAGDAVATNPGEKIVGIYKGTTLASCAASLLPDRCNAQQKVTISVIQGVDGKLKGYYKCAYGNQNCFHQQETGKVASATINGALLTMRVILPEGTSYIFNGRTSGDRVNGGYTASSGGAVFERGVWRARKLE